MLEEVNDFADFFYRLIDACNIVKSDSNRFVCIQLASRSAFVDRLPRCVVCRILLC